MPYRREAQEVVAEWHAVQLDIDEATRLPVDPQTLEAELEQLRAEADRLRDEYQRLAQEAQAIGQPVPPPFPGSMEP